MLDNFNQQRFKRKPKINGRDGKAVKDLLSHYPCDDIGHALHEYFNTKNDWWAKRGYQLYAFAEEMPTIIIGGHKVKNNKTISEKNINAAQEALMELK